MQNEPKSPQLHAADPLGVARADTRAATIALLVGTVFWGFGFTWAKVGGATINKLLGLPDGAGAGAGPVLLLAMRFISAGLLWTAIFPQARRGWTGASVLRATIIGVLVGIGLIVQHIGLDQTSQAVSAFLTSLTVVFVPLMQTVALRRTPRANVWLAVIVATAGVWVMNSPGGENGFNLGWGEVLGLLCAFVFSVYIIVLNVLVPKDDPYRITGGQFIVAGAIALGSLPLFRSGSRAFQPSEFAELFSPRDVWLNCALLVALPTLISYGLLTIYQPKLDATRAALIYLMEPIFASVYAWVIAGSAMRPRELLGAGMIFAANLIAELFDVLVKRRGGNK